MTKRILYFFAAAMLIVSCKNQGQKTEEQSTAKEVSIEALATNPMSYDKQEVVFEGTVGHVCRHSGERMRVMQTDKTDFSVLVLLGDFKSQINPESEGKTVKVTGIVKTEVVNMDELAENHEGHNHEGEEVHAEGGEEGDHGCASTEEAIKKLKEKGIDPNIAVSIELKALEIK